MTDDWLVNPDHPDYFDFEVNRRWLIWRVRLFAGIEEVPRVPFWSFHKHDAEEFGREAVRGLRIQHSNKTTRETMRAS